VKLTFTDAIGNTTTSTLSFTTVNYLYLPGSAALPASSFDLSQANVGFLVNASQVTSGQPNRMYWADEQLMGLHGTNHIDFATLLTTNGEVQFGDVVDFANTGAGGQFPNNLDWVGLGIPGVGLANDDNSAAAFATYLYFPAAGTYIMGANSDDGLRVTFARNSHDLLGTRLPNMFADFGRGIGSDQNTCAIIVTNAGYYGFRLLWENGGGGSAVEWYMKSTPAGTGTNVLINDIGANPDHAVKAYQVSSAAPPYVSYAEPPLDDNQFYAGTTIKYQLSDASTTVTSGSVVLKLNGVQQSPTIAKVGGVTTITLPAPASFWPAGTNAVELSFKDSANTNYDYQYSFVVPTYATLDPSQSVALGSQDVTKPGFVLTTTHLLLHAASYTGSQGTPNQSDVANAEIAGLFYPTYGVNGSTSPSTEAWATSRITTRCRG
jgi:hypothetical protein